MRETAAAERYARALFQALDRRKPEEAQAVQRSLGSLARAIHQDARLDAMFRNPLIPLEKKRTLIQSQIKGSGDPGAKWVGRFMDLLILKKRMDLLPWIAAKFEEVVQSSQGVLRAQVKSAAELDEQAKRVLEAKLSRLFGKAVQAEVSVHPELLAGMTVKAGDTVIDGSLRSQLKNLKSNLTTN